MTDEEVFKEIKKLTAEEVELLRDFLYKKKTTNSELNYLGGIILTKRLMNPHFAEKLV